MYACIYIIFIPNIYKICTNFSVCDISSYEYIKDTVVECLHIIELQPFCLSETIYIAH